MVASLSSFHGVVFLKSVAPSYINNSFIRKLIAVGNATLFRSSFYCSSRAYMGHSPTLLSFPSTSTADSRPSKPAVSLSVMSWSVDSSTHTHHHCRRRFSLTTRIPHMIHFIRQSQPDIVALQDSAPDIREALGAATSGSGEPSYHCIQWTRNGQCGELQLFVRKGSPWRAKPVTRGAGVSVEISYGQEEAARDVVEPSSPFSTSSYRLLISNVDLSYRGKSIGRGGVPLAAPKESLDGSPFAFSSPGRREGELDVCRAAALEYVSQVNRPDILVGNFYMASRESLPGYRDAWIHAGAPSGHERTTNTFYHHRLDRETNFFYFVPSMHVVKSKKMAPKKCSTACSTNDALPATGQVLTPSIGDRLPLHATVANSSSGPKGVRSRQWIVPENELPKSMDASAFRDEDSDKWIQAQLSHPVYSSTVGVPEVAGRYQRCFVPHTGTGSATHHPRSPFFKQCRKIRVLVLRPMTLRAKIGPFEQSWLAKAYTKKEGKSSAATTSVEPLPSVNGSDDNTSEDAPLVEDKDSKTLPRESSEEMDTSWKTFPCAPSSQYPLLIMFNL